LKIKAARFRDCATQDDTDVIFVANGHDVPCDRGTIQRSKDAAHLPVEPNSTMHWVATNRADPNIILANSIYGYIYLRWAIRGRNCGGN
jgi:hypothetical protein